VRKQGRSEQTGVDPANALAVQALGFDEVEDLGVFGSTNAGQGLQQS